ncbi:MAG: hypothetical protein U0796_11535 [Gemmatales bacterium]
MVSQYTTIEGQKGHWHILGSCHLFFQLVEKVLPPLPNPVEFFVCGTARADRGTPVDVAPAFFDVTDS